MVLNGARRFFCARIARIDASFEARLFLAEKHVSKAAAIPLDLDGLQNVVSDHGGNDRNCAKEA